MFDPYNKVTQERPHSWSTVFPRYRKKKSGNNNDQIKQHISITDVRTKNNCNRRTALDKKYLARGGEGYEWKKSFRAYVLQQGFHLNQPEFSVMSQYRMNIYMNSLFFRFRSKDRIFFFRFINFNLNIWRSSFKCRFLTLDPLVATFVVCW